MSSQMESPTAGISGGGEMIRQSSFLPTLKKSRENIDKFSTLDKEVKQEILAKFRQELQVTKTPAEKLMNLNAVVGSSRADLHRGAEKTSE